MLLRALVKQDGKQYSARCLELELAADGNTPAEALKKLKALIGIHLGGVRQYGEEDKNIPRFAPREIWQEFFEREDEGQSGSNISFYSVVIKEDGSRVLRYPF